MIDRYEHKKLIRITTVPSSLKVLLKRQLSYMSNYFQVIAVSSPGKMLDEVRVNEAVRTASIPLTRAITPLRDLLALIKLYRLFRKEEPLIVHSHTPKAGLLGMLAARFAGVPIRMHTVAGLPLMEAKGIKKWLLIWAERLTCRCAVRVYPNSPRLAAYISANRLCSDDKLKVLGYGSSNGIDTHYFQLNEEVMEARDIVRHRLKLNTDNFVFVFIGRLVKDKGIRELVQAFASIEKKYAHARLLLVGPFEQQDPLEDETIDKINQDDQIMHVSFQDDVRPHLAVSNVLVFPSYREGFPNVPMQAGCMHLPSIVTDINGCNEIIEDNKNGLIVPVKDSNALTAAMERLMTNTSLYHHLRSNCREMITSRYEQQYLWALLLNEYNDLIHQTAVSPLYQEIARSHH